MLPSEPAPIPTKPAPPFSCFKGSPSSETASNFEVIQPHIPPSCEACCASRFVLFAVRFESETELSRFEDALEATSLLGLFVEEKVKKVSRRRRLL